MMWYGRTALGLALVAAVAAGCATVGIPIGGPRDVKAPQVIRVTPDNETVNFRSKRIVFEFDEFIKVQGQGQAVFISPPPPTPPAVYTFNKQLVVELDPSELDASRTYVVTLSRNVQDFNEGNPIAKPLQYAFSTGSSIDSGFVGGRVRLAYTKAGALGVLVGLYDPDTVRERGLAGTRPTYVAPTDSQGYFQLGYLRPGTYNTFGFTDADGSFTYNSTKELIALDSVGEVSITQQAPAPSLEMQAFLPDTAGPRAAQLAPLDLHNLQITFSEPVLAAQLAINKTPAADSFSTIPFAYLEGKQTELILYSQLPLRDSLFLRVQQARDTLGNVAKDTLIRFFIRPGVPDTAVKVKLLDRKPAESLRRFHVQLSSPLDTTALASHVFVVDSNVNVIPGIRFVPEPHGFFFDLPEQLNPRLQPGILIDSVITTLDGRLLPRGWFQRIPIPDPDEYGGLTGSLATTRRDLVIQLVKVGETSATRQTTSPKYEFRNLSPGNYYLRVFVDTDRNGYWTPGRINPRRLPEPLFIYLIDRDVRARWEIDGVNFPFPPEDPNTPVPGADAAGQQGRAVPTLPR